MKAITKNFADFEAKVLEYKPILLYKLEKEWEEIKDKNPELSIKKRWSLLVEELYRALEESYFDVVEPNNKSCPPVCEKGCSYCCSIKVEIIEPEAFLLKEYIKKNYSVPKIKNIQAQARNKQKRTAKHKYYVEAKEPCIFLKKNSCSIYKIRPLTCRTYNSTNMKACKNGFGKPINIPIEFEHYVYYQASLEALSSLYEKVTGQPTKIIDFLSCLQEIL